MLLNSIIDLLFRGIYLVILQICCNNHWISITNLFSYWFILLLAEDFLYYWLHRWDHEIRFGTFQPELTAEEYQPTKYGLTKPIEKTGAVDIVFHEWQAIGKDVTRKDIGWKEKWQYVFGPPGWSHDGSRLTSQQMRQEEFLDSLDYLRDSSDFAADPQF